VRAREREGDRDGDRQRAQKRSVFVFLTPLLLTQSTITATRKAASITTTDAAVGARHPTTTMKAQPHVVVRFAANDADEVRCLFTLRSRPILRECSMHEGEVVACT